jgi:hypothetical protein
MLYSIDSDEYITNIPHKQDYDRWRSRLTEAEYEAIINELNSMIGDEEVKTSSWMPGNDWSGTVFDPIYSRACKCDESASAKFFGLLLWEVMLNHPSVWSFGRYEKDGIPIEGLTYFKIEPKK